MSEELRRVQEELIFKAGHIAANMGLNKSMGQLYAALYLSQKPIPLDDLARICRMSKGNASINIRRLERWQAARKVWAEESRKDYYEANRDIVSFAINHGIKVCSGLLQEGESTLTQALGRVDRMAEADQNDENRKIAAIYKGNIQELNDKVKKIKGLINNMGFIEKLLKGIL